ncbi:hypothetical protein ACJX0J_006761, partial [Zea mays]
NNDWKLMLSGDVYIDYYRLRFFWQGDQLKRKYRLAKWDILCQPKDQDDLGIQNIEIQNKCLLSKLFIGSFILKDGKTLDSGKIHDVFASVSLQISFQSSLNDIFKWNLLPSGQFSVKFLCGTYSEGPNWHGNKKVAIMLGHIGSSLTHVGDWKRRLSIFSLTLAGDLRIGSLISVILLYDDVNR